MKEPQLELDADVQSLPYGTRVGAWRLKGGQGIGSSGAVPRLLDSGEWRHPNGFHHPFIVMERIDGEPLYAWAARRNPASSQVLRLLAQAARALQATHEARGVHRDVKGAPYRSPEAWAYDRSPWRKSRSRYVAGPADDVFALGVMAYRLVTDEYPPFTDASMEEGKCWRPEGSGPRPPRDVNPRVSPALDAVILRMLSLNPQERGTAKELAEVMERGAAQARPLTMEGLFEWESSQRSEWPREDVADAEQLKHRPRRRSREVVRLAAEADAAQRAKARPPPVDALALTAPRVERADPPQQQLSWRPLLAAAVAALLLGPHPREPEKPEEALAAGQAAPVEERRDGGVIHAGDTALSSAHSFEQAPVGKGVAAEIPPKPLPGQLRPDERGRCLKGQHVINGGCWMKVELSDLDDCKGMGNGFEYKGGCYAPIYPPTRAPTSVPVKASEPRQ